MDKVILSTDENLTCGNEGTKREKNQKKKKTLLSFLGLGRAMEGKNNFLEREAPTSL